MRIGNQYWGQQWNPPAGVQPAVVSAVEVRGAMPGTLARVRNPSWILDYELLPYGCYRVHSARAPWQPRLPNTMHLYPPGVVYWEDTRGCRGPRHSLWIGFTGGESAGLARFVSGLHRYARFVDGEGLVGRLLGEAADLGQRFGGESFWAVQALFCGVVDALGRAEPLDGESFRLAPSAAQPVRAGLAADVEEYLRQHLADRIALAPLARHLHVSRSTLVHRYREQAGTTVKGTLLRLRIDQARVRLQRGEPLKAIAEALGFADEFHLSRCFKRIEGRSPRQFRHALFRESSNRPA